MSKDISLTDIFDELGNLNVEIYRRQRQLERLLEYVHHPISCAAVIKESKDNRKWICTCGLDSLIREIFDK